MTDEATVRQATADVLCHARRRVIDDARRPGETRDALLARLALLAGASARRR